MASSPEQLTQDIAATRARMGTTLDEVQDRVDPRQAWSRREPAVRSKVAQVKDTIMGTAQDTAGHAGDGVGAVKDRLSEGTQGNPLAAGLVAFGAGLLAGSIIPSSKAEASAVHELQEQLEEPVRRAVADSADEARDRIGGTVSDAVDSTREVASEATHAVAGSAKESVEHVKDESRHAAEDVRRDIEGN
jgi:uncharacterized protein YjbJ (UPF0337 family)